MEFFSLPKQADIIKTDDGHTVFRYAPGLVKIKNYVVETPEQEARLEGKMKQRALLQALIFACSYMIASFSENLVENVVVRFACIFVLPYVFLTHLLWKYYLAGELKNMKVYEGKISKTKTLEAIAARTTSSSLWITLFAGLTLLAVAITEWSLLPTSSHLPQTAQYAGLLLIGMIILGIIVWMIYMILLLKLKAKVTKTQTK